MQTRQIFLIVGLLVVGTMPGNRANGQPTSDPKSFRTGVYQIGVQRLDDAVGCAIAVISPTDGKIETVFRRESGYIYPGGRFSRKGDKLAKRFGISQID